MKLNKKSNDKGFTLIELLIVIIIIGILAAIAFVAYGSATSKAHRSDAQATVASVKEKLAIYNGDNNSYPATKADLDKWLGSNQGGNNKDLANKFGGDGYTYSATDNTAGEACGDTVTVDSTTNDATVAAGDNACTNFKLTGLASKLSFTGDDVTASN